MNDAMSGSREDDPRRPRTMRPSSGTKALRLLLLLCPAPALAEPCAEAYKPEYEKTWEVTQAQWSSACAAIPDARKTLRDAQQRFMRRCAKEFKTLNQGDVISFCAQGAPGRGRLREKAGVPPPPGKPPEEQAAAAPEGKGPLEPATRAAVARWGKDACLSAMLYHRMPFTLKRERASAGTFGVAETRLEPYAAQLQLYQYEFHNPSAYRDGHIVRYYDRVDPAFSILKENMAGPELEVGAKNAGGDCLGEPKLDVRGAVAKAGEGGMKPGGSEDVHVYLLSPGSWAEYYGRCERGLEKGLKFWCSGRIPARQLEKLKGKALWAVVGGGRTAFVDAGTGDFIQNVQGEYKAFESLLAQLELKQ